MKPRRGGLSWPRVVQVFGLAIMVYEVLFEQNDRPWIIVGALAMMAGIDTVIAVVEWWTKGRQ